MQRYCPCIDQEIEIWYNERIDIDRNGPIQTSVAELLQWSVVRSAREVRVVLDGEIDLASADALTGLLAEVIAERRSRTVVDLSRVTFMDSTGINSLLAATTSAARADGRKLVVAHPTPAIRRTFAICGVADILLEEPQEPPRGQTVDPSVES